MSDGTKIEWAANADGTPGATWNPIVGCSVISPGCTNCYAMREAARNERQMAALGRTSPYAGLTNASKAGPVWNGGIRAVADAYRKPLGWRKPRTIFVNSMGDLFHERARDEDIDRVFAVMALCPQHTFIMLTKRAERMRAYLESATLDRIAESVPKGAWQLSHHEATTRITGLPGEAAALYRCDRPAWPLRNVWGGVSIENRRTLYERLPHLLMSNLKTRVISFEPLLEDVAPFIGDVWRGDLGDEPHIDGCFVGGESGPDARPMHPAWVRGLRDWAAACKRPVAFFFKQWGEWEPRAEWSPVQRNARGAATFEPMVAMNADGSETPHDVNPDDVGGQRFARVGKRNAGRTLDGRTHDERPPLACEAVS